MKSCLLPALVLCISTVACSKIDARVEIREANELYTGEKYQQAIAHYEKARKVDGTSFPELDRMIGYCYLGLYNPDTKTPQNEKYADHAVEELKRYLRRKPEDTTAREALINLFLNSNRNQQAIDFFRDYLQTHPNDLDAVKSIATLYAKAGDFAQSLNWYKKITLLDSSNPEAFYIYGVVLYEKVSKNPPVDRNETLAFIEEGKQALLRAVALKPNYFEANVYMNLLFREQAKLFADNPEAQQQLYAKADEFRNRAIEINKAKKKS
ncbi:MAG: tetratricopeptide repeat protein [Acidobacteriota bacterium]